MKSTLSFLAQCVALVALMLGAPWLLFIGDAQAQIDVRQNGTYVGRARDIIDCRGSLTCSVDSGVAYLSGDGGTSGGSGVTPAGLCGNDGIHALGWDGGAYYCIGTAQTGSCAAGQFVNGVSSTGAPSCAIPGAADSGTSSFLEATLTAPQTTHLSVNDHIAFDSVRISGGSLVTCDTTTTYTPTANVASVGRCTLAAGHTYRLIFTVAYVGFGGTGEYVHFALWDADGSAIIGNAAQVTPTTGIYNNFGNGTLMAYYTPSASVRIEVRITVANGISAFGQVSTYNHFPTLMVENIN